MPKGNKLPLPIPEVLPDAGIIMFTEDGMEIEYADCERRRKVRSVVEMNVLKEDIGARRSLEVWGGVPTL